MGQNYYLSWNLFPLYKVWVLLYVIYFVRILKLKWGFPGGSCGKQHSHQCRRHNKCAFHPWARKISWRRAEQPTLVFLLGESHGQRSLGAGVGLQFKGSQRIGNDWSNLCRQGLSILNLSIQNVFHNVHL